MTTATETTAATVADKNACGTCRSLAADGKPVEHDGCAARAQLIEPPDMPGYEELIEMTLEERAALPARFHLPRFDDLGSPNAWLCTVCWDESTVTYWPCASAQKHGAQVFTR